jgi:hypothetical protein
MGAFSLKGSCALIAVTDHGCLRRQRAHVQKRYVTPTRYRSRPISVGSLSLLRAMIETGCLEIVLSSACAFYVEPHGLPIRASALATGKSLRSVGADPDGEIGELRIPATT